MPTRRRELELSVERPVGSGRASGTVARLTVRFEPGPKEEGPSPAELRTTLEELETELDALVGAPLAAAPVARAERELDELVEAYRPRQKELVDLLRDEGEITPEEHARLVAYLAEGSPPARPVRGEGPPYADRPIAAAPIPSARPEPHERTVPELLRLYGITSLKQAGAVRARRQISFAEYMALKRHFESGTPSRPGSGGPPPAGPKGETSPPHGSA